MTLSNHGIGVLFDQKKVQMFHLSFYKLEANVGTLEQALQVKDY